MKVKCVISLTTAITSSTISMTFCCHLDGLVFQSHSWLAKISKLEPSRIFEVTIVKEWMSFLPTSQQCQCILMHKLIN